MTSRCLRRVAALGIALAFSLGCERLIDAQIERNLTRVQTGLPDEPGLHVVLC